MKRKTLEELLGGDDGLTGCMGEESLLSHSVVRNTIVCRCLVTLTDPKGKTWQGERTIKIHMRRKV